MTRWLALVFALATSIAVAANAVIDVVSDDVARFTTLLASPVPGRRIEGVQGLSHLKHWPAEEKLLRLLDDQPFDVRREVLLAISRLGTARSIPLLIQLLADPSWEIRENAWLALERMTARAAESRDKLDWQNWWNATSLAQKQSALLAVAAAKKTNGAPGDVSDTVVKRGKRVPRLRPSVSPAVFPERREALRALRHIADASNESALIPLLRDAQIPPLDPDERVFLCEALERVGTTNALQILAAQRNDAAAWALARIGGTDAERALRSFPPTLSMLLALDRLHSTNGAPWIPLLVSQMAQITYRSHPDDVMNDDLQPIQRVGVNLIRRSGMAPQLIESVLQEMEDTMKPAIVHGARPTVPAEWTEMFKRMRSELKPGFVREDGVTTSQPIVAMCYLMGADETQTYSKDRKMNSPSPLNGERAGVRGDNAQSTTPIADVSVSNHPSPSIPLPVEGRGKSESDFVTRLIPLLQHPAIVPRVYVALALGRLHAKEALPALTKIIDEGYAFSDSTALASGKHFDQSQTVRWRGFVCMALGRLGGDEARLALERYSADAKQPRDVRYSSVVGLRFIGSPKSLPVLARVAQDDLIWMVRNEARLAAEHIETLNAESHPVVEARR